MNIIFLDIDGVLNIMSDSYRTTAYKHTFVTNDIEPHLVERLNYIIEKTNSNIVISSAWRRNMVNLEKCLKESGFKYWSKVIGKTTDLKRWRGEQIQQFIVNNPTIKNYIVLEDEVSDICGDKYNAIPERNVVYVDMKEGLSNENCNNAISKLNKI